jgi:hypothetical protein
MLVQGCVAFGLVLLLDYDVFKRGWATVKNWILRWFWQSFVRSAPLESASVQDSEIAQERTEIAREMGIINQSAVLDETAVPWAMLGQARKSVVTMLDVFKEHPTGLCKPATRAVNGISLALHPNEALGLIGSNGLLVTGSLLFVSRGRFTVLTSFNRCWQNDHFLDASRRENPHRRSHLDSR